MPTVTHSTYTRVLYRFHHTTTILLLLLSRHSLGKKNIKNKSIQQHTHTTTEINETTWVENSSNSLFPIYPLSFFSFPLWWNHVRPPMTQHWSFFTHRNRNCCVLGFFLLSPASSPLQSPSITSFPLSLWPSDRPLASEPWCTWWGEVSGWPLSSPQNQTCCSHWPDQTLSHAPHGVGLQVYILCTQKHCREENTICTTGRLHCCPTFTHLCSYFFVTS